MSGSGVSSVDSSSESSDGETTDDVTTTEDTRPSASHQLMGANRVNGLNGAETERVGTGQWCR